MYPSRPPNSELQDKREDQSPIETGSTDKIHAQFTVMIPEHAWSSILVFVSFTKVRVRGHHHSCALSNLLYDRRNDAITEVCCPSVGAVNSRESPCA